MTFWTAAVVIIAVICLTELLKTKYRARQDLTRDHPANENPLKRADPALEREVEELRERIKVLERIATEERESRRLSAEIESLRDK